MNLQRGIDGAAESKGRTVSRCLGIVGEPQRVKGRVTFTSVLSFLNGLRNLCIYRMYGDCVMSCEVIPFILDAVYTDAMLYLGCSCEDTFT